MKNLFTTRTLKKLSLLPISYVLLLLLPSCKEKHKTQLAKNQTVKNQTAENLIDFDQEWKQIQTAKDKKDEINAVDQLIESVDQSTSSIGISYVDAKGKLHELPDLADDREKDNIKTIVVEIHPGNQVDSTLKYQGWKPKDINNALLFLNE